MAALFSLTTLSAIPNVKLNNGVEMPMISLGTWQYSKPVAKSTVKLGISLGFNHIDTANDYRNQDAVGEALAGLNRSSYFLTTKVPSQTGNDAYAKTSADLADDLSLLKLDYVDLMLVHFPPHGNTQHCAAMQEQWRAMEDFYKAKKARAIGVSNYCPSSFECILKVANVTPAVNQVEYHIGMSKDPGASAPGAGDGIKSYCDKKGVMLQAYSPLGDGTSELITGPLVTGIGNNHNKSGAQVSLHWVYKHGVPLSTKSTSAKHLTTDLDIFDWDVTPSEMTQLDTAVKPAGKYSFMCTE